MTDSPLPSWRPRSWYRARPRPPQQSACSFIGNSFTFAPVAGRYYRADTVTDLNGEGIGGVPALFESFTRAGRPGLRVSLETRAAAASTSTSREGRRDREPRLGQGRDARLQHARRRKPRDPAS
jgi:hypothetical protein